MTKPFQRAPVATTSVKSRLSASAVKANGERARNARGRKKTSSRGAVRYDEVIHHPDDSAERKVILSSIYIQPWADPKVEIVWIKMSFKL